MTYIFELNWNKVFQHDDGTTYTNKVTMHVVDEKHISYDDFDEYFVEFKLPWTDFDRQPEAILIGHDDMNKEVLFAKLKFDYDGQPEVLKYQLHNNIVKLENYFTFDGIVKFDIQVFTKKQSIPSASLVEDVPLADAEII